MASVDPTTLGIPRWRLGPSRRWREPDKALCERFRSDFDRLMGQAQAAGDRVYFYTFSSRAPPWAGHDAVLDDLKGRWHLFCQSAVWRRLKAKVWTFGDHERPHIHLVVALPVGVTVHAVRDRWDAGHTYAKRVDLTNYQRLADYFAAQADSDARKSRRRRRYFGSRVPSGGA